MKVHYSGSFFVFKVECGLPAEGERFNTVLNACITVTLRSY